MLIMNQIEQSYIRMKFKNLYLLTKNGHSPMFSMPLLVDDSFPGESPDQ